MVMRNTVIGILLNIGNIWFVRGLLPITSIKALQQGEAFERIITQSAPTVTKANVNLARIMVRSGQIDDALVMWHKASTPHDPFLALELGEVYWQREDITQATRYWANVVDSDVFFALRGLSREKAGDRVEALADYRASWMIDDRAKPAKAQALLGYCEMVRGQGNVPLAVSICERSRESGNTWADMTLGMIYYNQHEFPRAEAYFRDAQQIAPTIPRVDLWLGLSIASQTRYGEAITIYARGLSLTPDDGWLNYEMAKALLALGSTDNVRHYLERSVQLATGAWDSWYVKDACVLLDRLDR